MLSQVRPSPAQRERLRAVSRKIITKIEQMAQEQGIVLQAMLVGSAARGTWLSQDYDLDIFLGVPESSDLGEAVRLARLVAPEQEERYAEHPYIHARVDGFEVDLVPCYLVDDASRLRSAVDRTPFHTRYIASRITGLEDEVLLLKQFLKGVGVYGSELKTGGFSGYLAELLVIHYRSFAGVLRAASLWRPSTLLELEGGRRGGRLHDEPLVVVDPVDPNRNVAAALTLDRMLLFSAAARSFLARPGLEFFFPPEYEPLGDEEAQSRMDARGTMPIILQFQAPDVVEDILYPQLRKAEESVRALMARNGFSVLRSDVTAYRDRAVMLFEMEVWELSRACSRSGPPVWEAEHAARFLAAHPHPLSGPYVRGGRVVVEEPRKHIYARDLLAAELEGLSLGKHLSRAIRRGHKIYAGREILQIRDREFRTFLARYLDARAPIS